MHKKHTQENNSGRFCFITGNAGGNCIELGNFLSSCELEKLTPPDETERRHIIIAVGSARVAVAHA